MVYLLTAETWLCCLGRLHDQPQGSYLVLILSRDFYPLLGGNKRVLIFQSLTVHQEDKTHRGQCSASVAPVRSSYHYAEQRHPLFFWIWKKSGRWPFLELKPRGTGSAICRDNPLCSVSFGCYICLWTITPSQLLLTPHTQRHTHTCFLLLPSTFFGLSSHFFSFLSLFPPFPFL